MKKLSERLPSRQEIAPVLAVIVFLVFSWTLYRMFWYVPSWLEYLSLETVLITAAYILAFALLESVILFGATCALSIIFPPSIFKQQFVTQASSVAVGLGAGAFLLQRKMKVIYRLTYVELLVYPFAILIVVLAAILILAYLFRRFEPLSRFVRLIADRMTIFLYVYLSLGVLGWLVVLFRNIR